MPSIYRSTNQAAWRTGLVGFAPPHHAQFLELAAAFGLQHPENSMRFMFYEAYRSEHNAVLHKQTIHYATWRDTVADMMAEPRKGGRLIGLLPRG